MKKLWIVLVLLLLCCGIAAADDADILGRPFPDFSVSDTQGNTFILSEALKDHDAVLINIWATWCGPCKMEMPYLNAAYEKYGDRVAFIVLSCEDSDTNAVIESYRQSLALSFPMGRDEGSSVYKLMNTGYIPATVIVDRFGNAAFFHVGSFSNAGEIERVLSFFLSDSYAQTTVLKDVPDDSSTRIFPVASSRQIVVEADNVRNYLFSVPGDPIPQHVCAAGGDSVKLLLTPSVSDAPGNLVLYDDLAQVYSPLTDLWDPQRNAYVYTLSVPLGNENYFDYLVLFDSTADYDDGFASLYLLFSEDRIDDLAAEMRSWGYDVSWKLSDSQETESTLQAYVLHVMDQFGAPVSGLIVNFCTDTACTPVQSDETGTIVFSGNPDIYHVQLLKAPENYSFDKDFELYTTSEYSEWNLIVCKD